MVERCAKCELKKEQEQFLHYLSAKKILAERERERWHGKFAIIKHENNILRGINKKYDEKFETQQQLMAELVVKVKHLSDIIEFTTSENSELLSKIKRLEGTISYLRYEC
jgi:hypothetical protein